MTEYMRRISDKIIAAHKQSCEEGAMEVAEHLLRALEADLSRIGGTDVADKRKSTEMLEAAFELHEEFKAKYGG